jgi:hypothetical protein
MVMTWPWALSLKEPAGVADGAVGPLDLEKPVALEGEVEFLTGGGELALGEDLGRGGDAGAVADLGAGGDEVAAAGVAARGAGLLVEHVLELDLAALEPGRVHVREVVGDRVEVELLGLHARGRGVEGEVHGEEELGPGNGSRGLSRGRRGSSASAGRRW